MCGNRGGLGGGKWLWEVWEEGGKRGWWKGNDDDMRNRALGTLA